MQCLLLGSPEENPNVAFPDRTLLTATKFLDNFEDAVKCSFCFFRLEVVSK